MKSNSPSPVNRENCTDGVCGSVIQGLTRKGMDGDRLKSSLCQSGSFSPRPASLYTSHLNSHHTRGRFKARKEPSKHKSWCEGEVAYIQNCIAANRQRCRKDFKKTLFLHLNWQKRNVYCHEIKTHVWPGWCKQTRALFPQNALKVTKLLKLLKIQICWYPTSPPCCRWTTNLFQPWIKIFTQKAPTKTTYLSRLGI